jgi:3-oxoacyl-[acyl-carrier-protein] synthase-3
VSSIRIASVAYELGATQVDDARLSQELRLPLERVAELSKHRLRYSAPDGVGPADIAAGAARRALRNAGMAPQDIDFIVFSTNTPDYTFPGSACLLQAAIGARTIGCLDVRSVCNGFVVALDLARRYCSTGTYGRVLVAAAEVPSHQNRYDGIDPELACLTGDAGCAAVVQAGQGSLQILGCSALTDGSRHRILWCEFPASRNLGAHGVSRGERLTRAAIEEGRIFPIVDFEGLRAAALDGLPRVLDGALSEAGNPYIDAAFIAHIDPRTEAAVEEIIAQRVGRVVGSDMTYAYSASLPLALARALEAGTVHAGETIAMLTAGGGASWGACIVRV